MNGSEADHPDVIVFPPVIAIATIVIAALLQWLIPIGLLARLALSWRIAAGAALVIAGVVLAGAGARALVRRGTNVRPSLPVLALAENGVFGWTRNPIYLGGGPIMAGIALIFGIDWLVLLMVPSLMILHFGVVLREEHFLERKFGDAYRTYKARVPRYFGPF